MPSVLFQFPTVALIFFEFFFLKLRSCFDVHKCHWCWWATSAIWHGAGTMFAPPHLVEWTLPSAKKLFKHFTIYWAAALRRFRKPATTRENLICFAAMSAMPMLASVACSLDEQAFCLKERTSAVSAIFRCQLRYSVHAMLVVQDDSSNDSADQTNQTNKHPVFPCRRNPYQATPILRSAPTGLEHGLRPTRQDGYGRPAYAQLP